MMALGGARHASPVLISVAALSVANLCVKFAVWFALPDHFLAIGVEGIVDDPLGCIDGMIVRKAEAAKPFGDGFKSGAFGLMVEGVVRVGAIDDLVRFCAPSRCRRHVW